jgi:integrase
VETARGAGDPLYAAWVLILVLGLRKGELLGLAWEKVSSKTTRDALKRLGRSVEARA